MRMSGAIHPLLHYVFMAWCSVKQEIRLHGVVVDKDKDNFTLTFTITRFGD
jgi:hypothetical protein